jgi:hypothetical protein
LIHVCKLKIIYKLIYIVRIILNILIYLRIVFAILFINFNIEIEEVFMAEGKFGNPGVVAMGSFALTTFVLSCGNAGLVPAAIFGVLPLALLYGGLTQFLAGWFEFVTGNTFGMVVFTGYGAFWMTFALLVYMGVIWKWMPMDAFNAAVGLFLIAWTIFNTLLTIQVFKTKSTLLISIFLLLEITFILLVIGHYSGINSITQAGGYTGILLALDAWYGMFTEISKHFDLMKA